MSKRAEKFRQMGEPELRAQEHDLRDQMFRLKFQMSMGNAESLKKLQQLRRDVARVKTVLAERRAEGK